MIILQPVPSLETSTDSQPEKPKRQTKIKALQGWFEKTQPTPSDFDPDQARWEALKISYSSSKLKIQKLLAATQPLSRRNSENACYYRITEELHNPWLLRQHFAENVGVVMIYKGR